MDNSKGLVGKPSGEDGGPFIFTRRVNVNTPEGFVMSKNMTKAERKAWWATLTPHQQQAYIISKMALKRASRIETALDTEFKRTIS